MTLTCAKAPCKSCPYRKDVPSGVWAAHEYEKLPKYDGSILEQVLTGNLAVFYCHQQDGQMCAGWVATHGAGELAALRLKAAEVDPAVWTYRSPVPVFGSGQEACDHGVREIEQPGEDAERVIERLIRTVPRITVGGDE